MDLRALLFTSDGASTATLCRLLADLGIEAEICPELLVAIGRLSTERYDAIIVDWSHETEAALLLKTAREKKALGLNLVLVPDAAAIPRALQQGANSVIKKPIDAAEAHDTLTTARDLILSRRFEQQNKESRVAALKAEAESLPELPVVEEQPAAKTGFLPQTMMQSALEAEQKVVKPEYSAPSNFQVARGPAAIEEEQHAQPSTPEPVGKKRWDEVRSVFRETPSEPTPEPAIAPQAPKDATGVFSSLPEQEESSEEPAEESDVSSPPSYLVFAVVACLLIAAVMYVWAPGDSYLGRVTSTFRSFSKSTETGKPATAAGGTASQATSQAQAPEKPAETSATPDPDQTAAAADTGPIPPGDVDSGKIQIIETKTIPKAGAQQPPKDPASDANASQPPAPDQAPAPAVTENAPEHQTATQTPVPVADPVHIPATAPAPQNQTFPAEPRTGVIIPDSLKTSPSPAPASSLETSSVPEETSLALLIHRVEPDYPQVAMAQRLDGPVVLQASIGRDGSVRDLKLVKGYFVLAKAAFDAVKQWRFKPYSPNGKAIDFQTTLTVNFKYPN